MTLVASYKVRAAAPRPHAAAKNAKHPSGSGGRQRTEAAVRPQRTAGRPKAPTAPVVKGRVRGPFVAGPLPPYRGKAPRRSAATAPQPDPRGARAKWHARPLERGNRAADWKGREIEIGRGGGWGDEGRADLGVRGCRLASHSFGAPAWPIAAATQGGATAARGATRPRLTTVNRRGPARRAAPERNVAIGWCAAVVRPATVA